MRCSASGPGAPTAASSAGRGGAAAAAWSPCPTSGDDPFWTGHPLAQANLYAFGRLAWDPAARPGRRPRRVDRPDLRPPASRRRPAAADPARDAWTTPGGPTSSTPRRSASASWSAPGTTTAPTSTATSTRPWGTYHFADRDGVGVDRTRGDRHRLHRPVPAAVVRACTSRSSSCPDELLLFFHHVPYGHVLHSGSTVIQHIYDTHFAGRGGRAAMLGRGRRWRAGRPGALRDVRRRLEEQVAAARVARPGQHVLLPQVRVSPTNGAGTTQGIPTSRARRLRRAPGSRPG